MSGREKLSSMRTHGVLIPAHRGVCGGNIPFNSYEAFEAALSQGAHILETDVTVSSDGVAFVFHPGQERHHLGKDIHLEERTAKEIKKERLVNFDGNATESQILTLEEFFEVVRGRCLVNLDHAWHDLPRTLRVLDRLNVRDEVILKTPAKEAYLDEVEALASDVMYMPIVREKDSFSALAVQRKLNFALIQVDFSDDASELASEKYIAAQHEAGRLVWVNALLYDYHKPLSGGHNDDVSITGTPEKGWGWLIDRGFDVIQTDWVGALNSFMKTRV
ncbi:MAG: glycerophosphodiester phosphodiesterase family protein [Eubacteriales bacterium]|nr:glycerophosphodiester phosphodiesterase family protein [Eubacteriales bacterium]